MRGLPGAGKTSLVQGGNTLKIIDPDNIKIEGISDSKFGLAQIKYKHNLREALLCIQNNASFIWCQPWSKIWGIDVTIENINQLTKSIHTPIIISVIAPVKDCYERYISRQKSLNREYLNLEEYKEKYIDKFEPIPSIYHSHHIISNILLENAKKEFESLITFHIS